jgi:CRP/FNR family transcriptional regulator, cyclic AMP receptor protein
MTVSKPRFTAPDPEKIPGMSEALRALALKGRVRLYRKGAVLIEEGDRDDPIYIILSGSLRAFATGESGREVTYGVYGPGEYLGEMSLDGGVRSASVVAEQASYCSQVARATLEEHLHERPEFAFELLAKVIRRARAATLSTKQLALNDVYGRLARLLNEQARAYGNAPRRVDRSTHLELSRQLGCSREMVSRLVKELVNGGWLREEAHAWHIIRPLPTRW